MCVVARATGDAVFWVQNGRFAYIPMAFIAHPHLHENCVHAFTRSCPKSTGIAGTHAGGDPLNEQITGGAILLYAACILACSVLAAAGS